MGDKVIYVASRWITSRQSVHEDRIAVGMISTCLERVEEFIAKEELAGNEFVLHEIEDGEEWPDI